MSMVICNECGSFVDTDYDVEGIHTDDLKYYCFSCAEDMELLKEYSE